MHARSRPILAPEVERARLSALLVVEDVNQERIFAPLLAGVGCDVAAVRGEDAAYERLDEGAPVDVVVLHLRLAAADDFGPCRRLRELLRPRGVPLLLLTASEGDQELGRLGVEAGADGLLSARHPPASLADWLQRHAARRPPAAAVLRAPRYFENLATAYRDAIERVRRQEQELAALRAEVEQLRADNEVWRRKSELLESSNTDLRGFNDMVCHDLRNSLVSVASFANFLGEDLALDPQHRLYLERLQRAGERALGLIDGLRRLSALSHRPLRTEVVDLSMAAREVVSELHDRDPHRQVDVRIEPDLRVTGDPELLWDVLQNLLGNAWKFTRERARARIELGARTIDGERVYFVRDDGVGFEPDRARDVFRPFTRLHARDAYEGHGIGLSTVERIVRRHGGRVWAQARPEAGAIFSFTLGMPVPGHG